MYSARYYINRLYNKTIRPLQSYVQRVFIMNLPIPPLRRFFIKASVRRFGQGNSVLMGVEMRNSRNISIGSSIVINRGVLLDGRGGKLIIGDNVDIGQETNIWTASHDINSAIHSTIGRPVIIEDYAWIASRVTILPGVRIGRGAVIGTGSIVTKDVPPMTVVAGNPASKIGERSNPLTYTLRYFPPFR